MIIGARNPFSAWLIATTLANFPGLTTPVFQDAVWHSLGAASREDRHRAWRDDPPNRFRTASIGNDRGPGKAAMGRAPALRGADTANGQ